MVRTETFLVLCLRYVGLGLMAVNITACLPIPHLQREAPAFEGTIKQDGMVVESVEVVLLVNQPVLPGCGGGKQHTQTDASGRFRLAETTYFTPGFMFGDRRDGWSLCFKFPSGAEAVWSDDDWWGGPPLQQLDCAINSHEKTVGSIKLRSLTAIGESQNYCRVAESQTR